MNEIEILRALARAREKAEHDEATALLNAWNKGRNEGWNEGRNEGWNEGWNNAFERIKSLLAQGFTFDQIEAMRNDE